MRDPTSLCAMQARHDIVAITCAHGQTRKLLIWTQSDPRYYLSAGQTASPRHPEPCAAMRTPLTLVVWP